MTFRDVDQNQLALGVNVEMEHTDDPNVAAIIAVDHLSEIPNYYTRLLIMEDIALRKTKRRKIEG